MRRATVDLPQPDSPTSERSEEHTSELQSRENLVCRLLLEKKKKKKKTRAEKKIIQNISIHESQNTIVDYSITLYHSTPSTHCSLLLTPFTLPLLFHTSPHSLSSLFFF